MNKQPTRPQSGYGVQTHPLWMRLLTIFCMALLGVASTVQVCHSHDDAFESSIAVTAHPGQQAAPGDNPGAPDSNSAVRCPLCVAMHSALPVTQTLIQVATLRFEPAPITAASAPRRFLWRFELASRPPPATPPLA